MNERRPIAAQAGVSIVEAMVALAIMAFGMLGLVGLQTSMRLNADIAKQRTEATRIAESQLERWRSFSSLPDYTATVVDVAASAASGPAVTNATYTWSAAVAPAVLPSNVPPLRTATVTVAWEDRASQPQSVSLTSQIAGYDPSIVGSLATQGQGGPVRRVYGRNSAVPLSAQNMGNGTSNYRAPDGSNVGWVINNASGAVVQLCDRDFTPASCTTTNLLLLSGYVNFSLNQTPVSEYPTSSSIDVQVQGQLTQPTATVNCFVERFPIYVAYYCAMPLQITEVPNFWSGSVILRAGSLVLATSATDNATSRQRVCRYTPEDTDTPSAGNVAHPLVYSKVSTSLGNQNFLVISAGDGVSAAYACPGDGPSTFVNTNTRLHQPRF